MGNPSPKSQLGWGQPSALLVGKAAYVPADWSSPASPTKRSPGRQSRELSPNSSSSNTHTAPKLLGFLWHGCTVSISHQIHKLRVNLESYKICIFLGAFCSFYCDFFFFFLILPRSIAEILRATAALLLGQYTAGVCRLGLEASPQSQCQQILQAIRKRSWQSRVQSPSIKICLPFLIQNAAGPQQSPPQSLASLGFVQKASLHVPPCFVPLKALCRGSAPIPMPIELFMLGPEMEFPCCCQQCGRDAVISVSNGIRGRRALLPQWLL